MILWTMLIFQAPVKGVSIVRLTVHIISWQIWKFSLGILPIVFQRQVTSTNMFVSLCASQMNGKSPFCALSVSVIQRIMSYSS
jgi:hypothetical protein